MLVDYGCSVFLEKHLLLVDDIASTLFIKVPLRKSLSQFLSERHSLCYGLLLVSPEGLKWFFAFLLGHLLLPTMPLGWGKVLSFHFGLRLLLFGDVF